jgi:hypothetical protein
MLAMLIGAQHWISVDIFGRQAEVVILARMKPALNR